MKKPSLWNLLREVHENEEGTVSLETILIIGAVALPILIFLYTVAWPAMQTWFKNQATQIGVDASGSGAPGS